VLLRLLTYNVRSLRDDGIAVSRVIRDCQPDVVCIQEAPRFLRWRSLAAGLARRSGLVVVGGGRPAGANLLLSSLGVDVERTWDIALSQDAGLHHRGASVALMSVRGARFAVAGTHLDLRESARVRHVDEIEAALQSVLGETAVLGGVPTILAGDINDVAGSATWAALTRARRDAGAVSGQPTFPAVEPRRRIDGIFVSDQVQVVSCQVLDSPDVRMASDHRPVLAELEIS
jgi:endonuclease/exonuclease/phosphatase family metal-dependent hydrolase